jgi:hypothetical protein
MSQSIHKRMKKTCGFIIMLCIFFIASFTTASASIIFKNHLTIPKFVFKPDGKNAFKNISKANNFQQYPSLIKDTNINKTKLVVVLSVEGALYAGSIAALSMAWYNNYQQTSFHFFNDLNDWMLMDKMGHLTASYYIGRIGYSTLRWSGVNETKSIWYGGFLGSLYLLNIEVMDGFSEKWGFSISDFATNTIGSFMFIGQQLGWNEQRFIMKFSFHPTEYPQYRPDLLGSNFSEQILKDYNGQTAWLSGNISSFLPKKSKFPKWINIAVGYGAEGMLGGSSNPSEYNGNPLPEFNRYHKFFVTADIDFTRIPTKSKALKAIFTVLNFIKIPFPAIEFNTNSGKNVKLHPFYF